LFWAVYRHYLDTTSGLYSKHNPNYHGDERFNTFVERVSILVNTHDKTRFNELIQYLKNNKWLSWLLAFGAIVIALATFTNALESIVKSIDELIDPPDLKIVDVILEDGRSSLSREGEWRLPTLDVKLRNTGPVSVLKRADFHVKKVWIFMRRKYADALEISKDYDVNLTIYDAPYRMSIPLSQEIGEGKTDRFVLTISNDAPYQLAFASFVFWFDLELIYDENNKSLELHDIILLAFPPSSIVSYNESGDPRPYYIQNWRAGRDIQKHIDGATTTESLQKLINNSTSKEAGKEATDSAIAAIGRDDFESSMYFVQLLGMLGKDGRCALPRLKKLAKETQGELHDQIILTIQDIEEDKGISVNIIPIRDGF